MKMHFTPTQKIRIIFHLNQLKSFLIMSNENEQKKMKTTLEYHFNISIVILLSVSLNAGKINDMQR